MVSNVCFRRSTGGSIENKAAESISFLQDVRTEFPVCTSE